MYLFDKLNKLCQEKDEKKRRVIFCGPSNKSVDLVASTFCYVSITWGHNHFIIDPRLKSNICFYKQPILVTIVCDSEFGIVNTKTLDQIKLYVNVPLVSFVSLSLGYMLKYIKWDIPIRL